MNLRDRGNHARILWIVNRSIGMGGVFNFHGREFISSGNDAVPRAKERTFYLYLYELEIQFSFHPALDRSVCRDQLEKAPGLDHRDLCFSYLPVADAFFSFGAYHFMG